MRSINEKVPEEWYIKKREIDVDQINQKSRPITWLMIIKKGIEYYHKRIVGRVK